MGFQVRKSLKAGPAVPLQPVEIGDRGFSCRTRFRVGTGPRGNYVHVQALPRP
jgi:hypothetical protein